MPTKQTPAWKLIVISTPLIVAVMWAVSIISVYNELPLVYEHASPGNVNTLLILIITFIISYGTFIFIRFKKK